MQASKGCEEWPRGLVGAGYCRSLSSAVYGCFGLDLGVIFPLGLMCLLSTTWKLHLGQKLWPFQGGFHDGIAFPALEWACVKNRKRVPKAN